ncbi:MAG: HPr kinase/phosphatase C-terminal domain-containing protein [Alphaproteobacteria bacterium]|nr:HPr kinase/phosphatase C-terminal domain-containing protein [Alphaproteobacteria bacterium]MBL6939708.1 HPr kinase/phosphatase C-terminal domain-containing protein [Alphaproteobacteria bacterium]MBL7096970.1 HPr kinase/phosphatase C-terminal domain-containing protein [Alphaproteobacteria bacterium]
MNIHATCVVYKRAGILLIGKSGSGKSDLALRLIALGARLVADDRTDLKVKNGALVATPPKVIAGLLEIRGVGIVETPNAASTRIALVVDLSGKVERLPELRRYEPPLRTRRADWPHLIALNAFEASAPHKVLAALRQGTRRRGVKRI